MSETIVVLQTKPKHRQHVVVVVDHRYPDRIPVNHGHRVRDDGCGIIELVARRPNETPEKLCPQCGAPMWAVTIPGTGRLLNCADCKVTMWGATLYTWKRQLEAEKKIDVRSQEANKYRSKKPCPECGEPMWALQEPGYGTRHQCEECRLTVLFGGAVAKWRGPKRTP